MGIFIVIMGLILLLYLIVRKELNAFLSLLLISIGLGVCLGIPAGKVVQSIETGMGSMLGSLTLILGLGAMIARLMEDSGAAGELAYEMLNKLGKRYIQWGVLLVGALIGLALFFDAGFVLLVPILLTMARQFQLPFLWLGMPGVISLLTVHALFPPHPGPVMVASTLSVNISKMMLLGLCAAVPAMMVAGVWYSRAYFRKSYPKEQSIYQKVTLTSPPLADTKISISTSAFIMLLPVFLIGLSSLTINGRDQTNALYKVIAFLGNPVIALLLTLMLGIVVLGFGQKRSTKEIMDTLMSSTKDIAPVLLINGAGGGLKQILLDSGETNEIAALMSMIHLSPVLAGFVMTAIMRILLGSSTVAAITAVTIVKPMLTAETSTELVALSIGAGSMFSSHVNDPGFWLFKEFFQLSMKETFRSWTVMTVLSALTALSIIYGMSLFL